jgi:protein-S-isoprenylcysteine O-methyltransferase Ste14
MMTQNAKAWLGLIALAFAMGLLLFVPAGSVNYPQAWAYLVVFFGTSALITRDLMRRDPALLQRRLQGGPWAEEARAQKIIMHCVSVGFVALLVVPALDRRFGWSAVPFIAVVAGDVLVAVGFYIIFLVYKVNSFSSATIEIAAGQKVISTGPYALLRHPMYAGASLYLLGTPLALDSFWGFLPLVATLPFLVWRLLDEENFLAANLPGYTAYQSTVKYRLVPFVW